MFTMAIAFTTYAPAVSRCFPAPANRSSHFMPPLVHRPAGMPRHPAVHHHPTTTAPKPRRPSRHSFMQGRPETPPSRPVPLTLFCGAALIAATLANRVVLTAADSMYAAQSRSDILAVVGASALVLYGLGKAELLERQTEVDLDGVEVDAGFHAHGVAPTDAPLQRHLAWTAEATLSAIPNVKSFAFISRAESKKDVPEGDAVWHASRKGLFRSESADVPVATGGVVETAVKTGQRAYLADMKVVPVREMEFGFLPVNCQAVIVQPVGDRAAIILGANKPRPMTSSDFGWLQAMSDRLETEMQKC